MAEFASELIFFTEISANVCEKINKALNLTPSFPPITDTSGFNLPSGLKFTGSYSTTNAIDAYPVRTENACFLDGSTALPTSGHYYYYQVLIAR